MPAGPLADDPFCDFIAPMIAPDPGGILARADVREYIVEPLQTPIQRSPPSHWFRGWPLPGPFATVPVYVDYDSIKWWGQGYRTLWSRPGVLAELPSMLPFDLPQHIDAWHVTDIGRNPNIA